ncbi:cyanoglobin [Thalassobacter stenotrophicus]|uniref:group II truncated hemoglobin n=1 Tax=Thalassobacter TaxID=266808 RepID=UPI00051D9DA6|nr:MULTISPECIES: group II truncated hemoglobin [Thalassobacter]KGK78092.1 cyanoglobin [Thalassobacter stenotrophicus]KGL02790.1 cyanoglobin [Thalassobacter sp. 16PALIMAR09]
MSDSLLDQIGGEAALHRLVHTFYDLMETDPVAHRIHRLHFRGHGLDHTRAAQVEFMSGFMGGRQYYRERHGHMDVREIHAHVPIRTEDAEVWLATWDKALDACGHSGPHIDKLCSVVRRVALMLVNDVPDWREGET